MGFIYKITCKETQKIYIGQTNVTIQERWKNHCKTAFLPSHGDYNFAFHRAIRKYGVENFIIEQIEECSAEKLAEREKFWILFYNSYNEGYNSTLGGDGQCKYNYDEIVNYYLNNNFSILKTCQFFNIYDQVVYSALKSKNINYKQLQNNNKKTTYNKKILCVELNKVFNSMKEIDLFFNKQVHGNIRRCLNGITKKAYGYTWKEIDEE